MFEEAGADVDFIVDHLYAEFETTYGGLQAWPQHQQRLQVTRMLQELFQAYSPDRRALVPVYNTEYNLVLFGGFTFYGPTSPVYQLVNGLVTADMLGVWQTLGVQGSNIHDQLDFPFATNVPITDGNGQITDLAVQATGYALELYNKHWGSQLVDTSYRSPTYDIPIPDEQFRSNFATGGSALSYPYQTAYASLSADGRKLYVMLVNKSGLDAGTLPTEFTSMPIATQVSLNGFIPAPGARTWTLTADELNTWNVLITGGPGAGTGYDPDAITIQEAALTVPGATFTYTTPPHSATVIELTRRP